MPMTEPAYFTAFKNFAFTRTPSGVLTLRFHRERPCNIHRADAHRFAAGPVRDRE